MSAVDVDKGLVEVRNGYDITNLAEIAVARYRVRADDRALAEGRVPALDIAPGASKRIAVPVPLIEPEPGAEY